MIHNAQLQLIAGTCPSPDDTRPEIAIRVDRLTLAKRLWRGTAEDGREFGFELETPLRDGDVIFQTTSARYVVRQQPEPLLAISLQLAPSAAACIGWAVGNLHLELSAEPTRLLLPDESAGRQLLDRLKIPYGATTAVFKPGRFARGEQPTHELGSSHQH